MNDLLFDTLVTMALILSGSLLSYATYKLMVRKERDG